MGCETEGSYSGVAEDSGLLRRVDWYTVIDTSKNCGAFVFMVKLSVYCGVDADMRVA